MTQYKICLFGYDQLNKVDLLEQLAQSSCTRVEGKRISHEASKMIKNSEIKLTYFDTPTISKSMVQKIPVKRPFDIALLLFTDTRTLAPLYACLELVGKSQSQKTVEFWGGIKKIFLIYAHQESTQQTNEQLFIILSQIIRKFNSKADIVSFLLKKQDKNVNFLQEAIEKWVIFQDYFKHNPASVSCIEEDSKQQETKKDSFDKLKVLVDQQIDSKSFQIGQLSTDQKMIIKDVEKYKNQKQHKISQTNIKQCHLPSQPNQQQQQIVVFTSPIINLQNSLNTIRGISQIQLPVSPVRKRTSKIQLFAQTLHFIQQIGQVSTANKDIYTSKEIEEVRNKIVEKLAHQHSLSKQEIQTNYRQLFQKFRNTQHVQSHVQKELQQYLDQKIKKIRQSSGFSDEEQPLIKKKSKSTASSNHKQEQLPCMCQIY